MRFYFVFCSLEKIMIFTQGCVSVLGALDDECELFFFSFSRYAASRCRSRRRRSFHCSSRIAYTYFIMLQIVRSYVCVRVSYMELDKGVTLGGMGDGCCENCIITEH